MLSSSQCAAVAHHTWHTILLMPLPMPLPHQVAAVAAAHWSDSSCIQQSDAAASAPLHPPLTPSSHCGGIGSSSVDTYMQCPALGCLAVSHPRLLFDPPPRQGGGGGGGGRCRAPGAPPQVPAIPQTAPPDYLHPRQTHSLSSAS